MQYVVVYYDGCNGLVLGGITTKYEIEKRFGPVDKLSRNDDGLLELGDTCDTFAIPTNVMKEFVWDA